MKYSLIAGAAMTLAFTGAAGTAEAASFTADFCPAAASCPVGVTEASLTLIEVAGGDVNDYTLILRIVGNALAPQYVRAVDFTLAKGEISAAGYEVLPTLTSAPGGVASWSVSFDKINQGNECNGSGDGQAVCAEAVGAGTSNAATAKGTTNEWVFNVDFGSNVNPFAAGSLVNMRAQFLNANGSNAGILSPGEFKLVQCAANDANCDDVPDGSVPEPTLLGLLGFTLLGAGYVRRRKQ